MYTASMPNFEASYFGVEVAEGNAYNALETLTADGDKFAIVDNY